MRQKRNEEGRETGEKSGREGDRGRGEVDKMRRGDRNRRRDG